MSSKISELQRKRKAQKGIVSKYHHELQRIVEKSKQESTPLDRKRLDVIKVRLEDTLAIIKKMNSIILEAELETQRSIEQRITSILSHLEQERPKDSHVKEIETGSSEAGVALNSHDQGDVVSELNTTKFEQNQGAEMRSPQDGTSQEEVPYLY